MRQMLIGGMAALLLVVGGFFLWQGASATPDPIAKIVPPPEGLPEASGDEGGTPPPGVPTARAATREERRFQHYDRNRDGTITRIEMLSSRSNAFRRLDTDHNNLLSFEEWAVKTSDRFAGADADHSGTLSAAEFAATAPHRRAPAHCACQRSGAPPAPDPAADD